MKEDGAIRVTSVQAMVVTAFAPPAALALPRPDATKPALSGYPLPVFALPHAATPAKAARHD